MRYQGHMGSGSGHGARQLDELSRRARLATTLVVVNTALYVGFNFSAVVYNPNAGALPHGPIEHLSNLATLFMSVMYLITFIGAGIAWGRWVSRAYGNLSEVFGEGTSTTPGTAAWSYVIPFVSLYWPYQHMSEVWWKTAPGGRVGDKSILQIWWFFWITHNIVSQIQARALDSLTGTAHMVSQFMSMALYVCAAIFAVKVVQTVTGFQVDLLAERARAQAEAYGHSGPTGHVGPTGHQPPPRQGW